MRYLIRHETRLRFAPPAREHQCELRLVPRTDATQRVLATTITTEPAAPLYEYTDAFGNLVHAFSVIEPHERLVTRVETTVETSLANPFAYEPVAPPQERFWIAEALQREPRLHDYVLHRSPSTPALGGEADGLAFPAYDPARPLLESVQEALAWIDRHFTYDPDATRVHATLAEVLERRAGVCQDLTHLLLAIVRAWGVPARYVAGYQDTAATGDGEPATHAWAEVLVPGAGWRGFDATNLLLADETYVAVAMGRDSRDAAPQRGSMKGDDDEGGAPEVALRVVRDQ